MAGWGPWDLCETEFGICAANNGGSVTLGISKAIGERVVTVPTPGEHPMAIAYDGKRLWVPLYPKGMDTFDPGAQRLTGRVDLPAKDVVWDGTSLWATVTTPTAQLLQFDPETTSVLRTVNLPAVPNTVFFDGDYLWLAAPRGVLMRVTPSDGATSVTTAGTFGGTLAYDGWYVYAGGCAFDRATLQPVLTGLDQFGFFDGIHLYKVTGPPFQVVGLYTPGPAAPRWAGIATYVALATLQRLPGSLLVTDEAVYGADKASQYVNYATNTESLAQAQRTQYTLTATKIAARTYRVMLSYRRVTHPLTKIEASLGLPSDAHIALTKGNATQAGTNSMRGEFVWDVRTPTGAVLAKQGNGWDLRVRFQSDQANRDFLITIPARMAVGATLSGGS